MSSENWKQDPWLAIDVETTGLDPKRDRVVSLAVARREPSKRSARVRQWIVNPGIPIPEEVTAIHGISDADVADKPPFDEVASEVIATVGWAPVLVAYHWPFDDLFLLRELRDPWEDVVARACVVDPLVIVRHDDVGRYWRGKGRHTLENVARRFKLALPAALRPHMAVADAWMTIALLAKLVDEHGDLLPDEPEAMSRWVRQEREEQNEQFAKWLKRQKAEEAKKSAEG